MKKTSTVKQQTTPTQRAFKLQTYRHQLGRSATHDRLEIITKPKSTRRWWQPHLQIWGKVRTPSMGLTLTAHRGHAPVSTKSKEKVTPQSIALTPSEVWMAIEDLWLRLLVHGSAKLSCQQGIYKLVFVGLQPAALDDHAGQLLSLVGDRETYVWHVQGQRGQFIDDIECQGSDLILQLKPLTHIQRWHDGEQMACEVESFLLRLHELVNRRSTSALTTPEGASL